MENKKIDALVKKWDKALVGIEDSWTRKTTAQLMENQAAAIINSRVDEDAATTVGKLGTFQKFAFPIIKRVYPELLANKICGVQPMPGPVSQIFYIGHDRVYGATAQTIYSKYNLTYRNLTAAAIGSVSGDNVELNSGAFDTSDVLTDEGAGAASATFGGQIAAWPDATSILGVNVSAGEAMSGSGIPEINFHIEQQPVAARTRKMRALWTIEAAQDLKAYHDMNLESELTDLLGKELRLEIDRELIEDLRGLAYNLSGSTGGFNRTVLDQGNSNSFGADGTGFTPAQYLYDFGSIPTNPAGGSTESNLYAIDFTSSSLPSAPQHVGHQYANLLALINQASQDIYRTTLRGPGSWLLTSPLIASFLESASKLEGGISGGDGPSNMGGTSIEYKGKFAGRYDLFVDPLYPTDELLMGYKGSTPMDAGFVYAPYIPLQELPTIFDPETFQPRKGILTRYGKAEITPASRFYRVIRIVGPTATYLTTPFGKAATNNGLG
jgi:hypothetical protein